jgi:hypothetical protein
MSLVDSLGLFEFSTFGSIQGTAFAGIFGLQSAVRYRLGSEGRLLRAEAFGNVQTLAGVGVSVGEDSK